MTAPGRVSLLRLFLVFARVGAFTIGGGYAMIPLIEAEMKKRKWIPVEELPDIVALSQSAPGLLAVNISIFAGYRLRGLPGAIAATLGATLPSFLMILAIAMVFSGFKDNPWVIRAFRGVRPVVVALILVPMIKMARSGNRSWWTWLLSAAALIAVSVLGISPVWILLCVATVAYTLAVMREKGGRR